MILQTIAPSASSRRLALALVTACGLAASSAHAETYYWRGNGGTDVWSNAGKWNSQEDGSGTAPASILSSDHFVQSGVTGSMGTAVVTSGTTTFAGATLTLAGGQIAVKGTGTGVARVVDFIAAGTGLITAAQAANAVHNLRVENFQNQSGTTRLSASTDANGRTLNLSIGTLTGAGGFSVDSASGSNRLIQISVTDASGYTGDIGLGRGLVDFNTDINSGGSLTLSGSVVLTLDQSISFTAVTINGTPLGAGTHTFAELNGAFDAFFADGGTGSITVASIPEPSTAAALAGAALLGFAALRRRRG